MTSTLRVTASNKFTLFDLKTRQIAVRNAFWKGSFVRMSDIHVCNREGPLCLPRAREQRVLCALWSF